MLPEETQVEDSIISVLLLMLQLCQNFFLALGALFWGLSTCPPKCLCTCLPVPKRCLNRYIKKKEHKTTIDNEDIKNLLGQIPCKRRSHGALTTHGYQAVTS